MKYTVSKLLEIAIAELGYCEKASNSQLDDKTANAGSNNYTKYARDLHNAGYYQANKNGYAWCDMFVDWCFYKLAGGKGKGEYLECQTGLYGAGCQWSSRCYRTAGRFDKNPKPGDQIFFGKSGSEEHTGIVEKVENGRVHTIEGNSSNKVQRRSYALTNSRIVGYGHPRFDEDDGGNSGTSQEITTPSESIEKGDTVKIIDGATYYSGKAIPAWVKAKKWVVKECSGDRVVIDKSEDGRNAINSPVNTKYLSVVRKASGSTSAGTEKPTNTPTASAKIEVGDTATIAQNAYYYNSTKQVPAWVRAKKWIVSSVSGSRIVINKSTDGKNAINSAVDAKYLTVVEKAAAPWTPAVGDKVLVNGTLYYTGKGTGNSFTKKNTTMYICDIVNKKVYPYYIGVAYCKGGVRQGWVKPDALTKK